MTTDTRTYDPFSKCEEACSHDLASGVLVEDLLGGDGPFVPMWVLSGTGGAFLLDADHEPHDSPDETLAA